jgi:hypothetical protein
MSVHHCEEITVLNKLFALVDTRPDPGIYRNADSDGAARDLVELNMLFSFADPRPFTNPWMRYFQAEDLFDQPAGSQ